MSTGERAQFEASMLQFLQSELQTGMTFASLARDSQTDEKRRRNQQNARKAYDTAKHFLEEHSARGSVAQPHLLEGLTELKNVLVRLGESFGE